MFHMFQMYVASVLSGCCICCSSYIHMLQTYVSIVLPCYFTLQQVLLPMHSDLRASTRCTRRPYSTRRGPPRWSMQPAQHMCMHAVLPPSFSYLGARVLWSLCIRVGVLWSLSLACSWGFSHIGACTLFSLLNWGMRIVFPLFCISCALSRIKVHVMCSLSIFHRRRHGV
jgi:hypothetical protein